MDSDLKVLLMGKEREIKKLLTDVKSVPSNAPCSSAAENNLVPPCLVTETEGIPNSKSVRAENWSNNSEMRRNMNNLYPNYYYKVKLFLNCAAINKLLIILLFILLFVKA